ncbi:MAG: hypothetical protein QE271_10995 [Bacteriovoracaceae bacterium]|nr:hypothetical protein [Bacteriovoracaceae bacterium]
MNKIPHLNLLAHSNCKILFIFAHRGEANDFLEDFRPIKHESKTTEPHYLSQILWQHKENANHHLLITGEGVFESLKSTTAALTYLSESKQRPDIVINSGLAGSLSPSLSINDWAIIGRVCYCQEDKQWQFSTFASLMKSQQNSRPQNLYNCVSFSKRVFDQETRSFLSTQGHLVDRELWGIANACQSFKIPWLGLKLISDDFSSIENEECRNIRGEWKKWSELIDEFLKNFLSKGQNPTFEISDENFFFTKAMEHKFQYWNNRIKDHDISKIKASLIHRFKDATPKTRAKILLQEMEILSQPDFYQMKNELQNFLKNYETPEHQIKIKIDETLETDEIQFILKASTTEELAKSISTIKDFNFKKYISLLNGESL